MTSEATEVIARTGAVNGRVTHGDGSAAAGVTVSVVARKLRSVAPLGQVATDAAGSYELEFTVPAGTTAFVVEAAVEGQDPVQTVRPVSGALDGVDMTLPGGGADTGDYVKLLAQVTPLLAGTPLTALVQDDTHDDLTNLAVATGRPQQEIANLAAATRLAETTGLPAEPLYGLLSQGLPSDIPGLAQQRAERVTDALAAAAKAGTITTPAGADAIVAAVRAADLGLAPSGSAAASTRVATAGVVPAPAHGSGPAGPVPVSASAGVSGAGVVPAPADGSAPAAAPVPVPAVASASTAVPGAGVASAPADGSGPTAPTSAPAPQSALAAVFTVAVPDPAARERLYSAYLDRTAGPVSFAAAGADATYDERLRLALHLGTLTDSNAPLVGNVLARFDGGELTQWRELVKLDGDWEALTTAAGGVPQSASQPPSGPPAQPAPQADAATPAPADPAAADPATATPAPSEALAAEAPAPEAPAPTLDALIAYAETIRTRVAEAYPTPHIAYKLSADPQHAKAPATEFLSANPDFDLTTTPVTPSVVPDAAARSELGAMQRTFKVAKSYDGMQALRGKGFTSSYAIASIGADSFATRVAGSLDAAAAKALHGRATQVHAAAVNLLADLRTATQVPVPWLAGTGTGTGTGTASKPTDPTAAAPAATAAPTAAPAVSAGIVEVPDWEELFGSADYATVEDSRSIYSQGAYLVDLMYYLRRLGAATPPPTAGGTVTAAAAEPAVDQPVPTEDGSIALELYDRRPDLWDLEISKENTELTLPYIDLVNELLESAVSPEARTPDAERQSSGTSGELRIQPQFVNAGAYDRLRAAVYPWDLPFDLYREQTATFLDHLGVTRDKLLATLGTGAPDAAQSSALLTAERLGLTFAARQIVAGEVLTPARTLAEFYGLPLTTSDADLAARLSDVRVLLDTAGLHYGELTDVLATRFVNPDGALTILADEELPYDTTKMTLQGLSTAALDRLHRFVRLWRAVGGSAADLDRLIQAAGNQGRLDALTLRCIAAAMTLGTRLNVPLGEVPALVRPLDTYAYASSDEQPPLYERLFLNTAVVTTAPGETSPFALNADRTELAVVGSLDTPELSAALLAVLQVSDAELTAMVGGPDAAVTSNAVNLANMTVLYAVVTLARALDLPIADLLRLARISLNGAPWAAVAVPAAATAAISSELSSGQVMTLPTAAVTPPPRNEPAAGDVAGPAGSGLAESAAAPAAATQDLESLLAGVTDFLDLIGPVLAAGFTVPEIDAVLTATYPATGGPVPDDAALATTLTALRAALQTVYQQTATDSDDKGTLTGKQLSLLGWDAALVQDAVATLLGTTVYSAQLDALPAAVALPTTLPVRFQADDQPAQGQLLFTGPMDDPQRQQLLDLSAATDTAYRTAVEALYQAPRTFVTGRMKSLRTPVFSAPLPALPTGYQIPTALSGKVFFDATAHTLRSRTYLSATDLASLKSAPGADQNVVTAVDGLATAQEAPAEAGNVFLDQADLTALFTAGVSAADRFHLALDRLNPYLRRALSVTAVVQQLGQAASLDPATAQALIATWLLNPAGQPVVEDFLLPEFAGSDTAVTLTRAAFGVQFGTLALIHRVALVTNRLQLASDQIPFVIGSATAGAWLNLNTLPQAPTSTATAFPALRALTDLVSVRNATPGRMVTVQSVLTRALTPGAAVAEVIGVLSAATTWDSADLAAVAAGRQFTAAPQLARTANLLDLIRGLSLLGRLGVSGARATLWLVPELTQDAGRAAWGAAKALHSAADWLTVAGPLQDIVRDRRRSALVSYLLANPLTYIPPPEQQLAGADTVSPAADPAPVPYWTDANGLHDYFLLDVEMSAVQLTTRVAQAAYTVQLFVQRCLMNLEDVPTGNTDADLWAQWEWMQQYQLWAANQKVFLYPENYFEPDLRSDKSPLFTDMETELTQKDLTNDNVQAALVDYLDGLDEVARLQPSGLYVDAAPNSAVGDYSGETVHVLARSESAPKAHYYRTWVNRLYWTPWQKVNLDIDGESMTMGLWNNRLYVFWPTYMPAAAPKPVQWIPDGLLDHAITQAPNYYDIQLNWSEFRNGAWTPKRISSDTLKSNITLPANYTQITYSTVPWTYDPANTTRWMFRPAVDAYSNEPVIWAHYNRSLYARNSYTGSDTANYVWGRFRLSKRRGTLVTDQIDWAPYDLGHRVSNTPYDPNGATWNEGMTGLVGAPDGANTVNNDWLEDQSGAQVRNQLLLPFSSNLGYTVSILILAKTPNSLPFRVVRDHQWAIPSEDYLLLFADSERTYLLWPHTDDPYNYQYEFIPFYHPHVEFLKSRIDNFGLDGLFDREVQVSLEGEDTLESFADRYSPSSAVLNPYLDEGILFDSTAPYAVYNWELFFHAPLLLAERLSTNQQFEAAQTWFHRIFDPTDRSDVVAPYRYWRTKPFFLTSTDADDPDGYQQQRIEEVLAKLAAGDPVESAEVDAWLRAPFQPDVVARTRTTAYQKAVVMKYLDNLIAWGDQLFGQDTLESINKATQLYVLASELLGRRPEEVPQVPAATTLTYRTMTSAPPTNGTAVAADPAFVVAENLLPAASTSVSPAIAPGLGIRWLEYFGIPRNEKLLGYWDTVDDRLFKIRNGQNLDGVTRQVALFGAPIDPSVLVKATSAGVDLATVLDDMSAPLPYYRFGPMVAKAKEFAGEVKAFGSALLSALEKRDGEELARLRSTHEVSLLNAVLAMKNKQKEEADKSVDALIASRNVAVDKQTYYIKKTQNRLNDKEVTAADLAQKSITYSQIAAGVNTAASASALIPDFKIGSPMTVGATFGGQNILHSMFGMANGILAYMGVAGQQGQQSATLGGYDHRFDDWSFQKGQAGLEITQLDSQLTAARVRQEIAQKDLDSQHVQITDAAEDQAFLYSKYTNQELYNWMVGQLTTSYFQAYQLAYDVAKRAERAYRHELGLADSGFVRFGYWDSLHKGLLSGERLAADLNRLDAAFYEGNAREYELSKRFSLAQLDPEALLSLKETGRAYVSLPEALFDLDTPGHYMRRIKSVSITVPSVAGPYSGVNLTATLLSSSVRVDSRLSDGKYARQPQDTRFRDYSGPIESIVTSTGQDDSGLFETNLRDERFLPFEGSGAVGEWQLSLPSEFRQFDYESISDVVLHVRYTAREGGSTLSTAAVGELRAAVNGWLHAGGGKGLHRTLSARREFPDQWSRFLTTAPGSPPALAFTVSRSRFPYLFRDESIKLTAPELVLVLSNDLVPDGTKRFVAGYADGGRLTATLTGPGGTVHGDGTLVADPALGGQPHAGFDTVSGKVTQTDQDWAVTVPADQIAALDPALLKDGRLNPDAVIDLLLVWNYSVEKVNEA